MYTIAIPDSMIRDTRAVLLAAEFQLTLAPQSTIHVPSYVLGRPARRIRNKYRAEMPPHREFQVLMGTSQGLTYRQISTALQLKESTTRSLAVRLHRRIGANHQAHAVSIGYQRGWLGGAS